MLCGSVVYVHINKIPRQVCLFELVTVHLYLSNIAITWLTIFPVLKGEIDAREENFTKIREKGEVNTH